MNYSSRYGRAAVDGVPQGTSGETMVANLGKWWPGLSGEQLAGVDGAIRYLRAGSPLLFLAKGASTYKFDTKGNKQTKAWPGHFMVLLGVESDGNTFSISDPSGARHKFIDKSELSKCLIWRIFAVH
jgi:hypothetical protein